MSILIVGTVAFDTIETKYGLRERVIGGSAQYAGYSASYLYQPINLVSIIGDDFPQSELKSMQERSIRTEGIKVVKNGKSFFWSGKYHDDMNGRETLITDLNVLADFDPIIPASYQDSEYVLLGNLTPDIQISVINQLKKKPKIVVLDTMNLWIDIALDKLKEALALCDVLTINDEEARMLSGEFSLVSAASKILKMGPSYLIIKKGEHGSMLFGHDQIFFAPALPLEKVVDPTGAGDCFAGGFIGYLAKTGDLSFDNMKRAIIHGSTMASFVVEDFSNHRLKKLTQTHINDRLMNFVQLTRFSL